MTAGDSDPGGAWSANATLGLSAPSEGFEEHDVLRSAFIRELIEHQIDNAHPPEINPNSGNPIPRHLIQYWHDQRSVPDDVRACLSSWWHLSEEGFRFSMFNDESAAAYIQMRYGAAGRTAFERCHHPAMRCDYLRMCALVAEGGLYVDADDVLLGDGWRTLFQDRALKVQPLCFDLRTRAMVPAEEIWHTGCSVSNRIFYVNNDPIAAPPEHPLLCRALRRATARLLGSAERLEIQSTTGPGNLTAALAAHARDLILESAGLDFRLLRDWERIAETRWQLSYRGDERNWRNVNPY